MDVRPNLLNEVIGQQQVKEQLRISIEACKINNAIMPHVLFTGFAGCGKTTLAQAIANELNCPIEVINGSSIRSLKNLIPCLARIKRGSILFCDEIHKTPELVQTYLLTVLEQFKYTLGSQQDSITLSLQEFTFIGATTNTGALLAPLINRFTYFYKLSTYSEADLAQIISVAAPKMGMDIAGDLAIIIAKTCRGTPRTAINRLRWIKDFVTARNVIPSKSIILEALKTAQIGLNGLEEDDKTYLRKLLLLQPAGINTLASATNIDKETIEKNIEPFLIQQGLIKKTPRGRVLTL